jgi:hypothetical protein
MLGLGIVDGDHYVHLKRAPDFLRWAKPTPITLCEEFR